MTTQLRLLSVFALSALFSMGCSSFVAATPPQFVELPDSKEYDYRATSADGLVLAVRAIDNEPVGSLAFWSEVIERRLRDTEGYALLEKKDVSSLKGEAGSQLRFGRDVGGAPHLYNVTIFVTKKRIFLLEAGGS